MAALATGLNFSLFKALSSGESVSVPIVTLPLGIFDGPLRPLVVDHGARVFGSGRLPAYRLPAPTTDPGTPADELAPAPDPACERGNDRRAAPSSDHLLQVIFSGYRQLVSSAPPVPAVCIRLRRPDSEFHQFLGEKEAMP